MKQKKKVRKGEETGKEDGERNGRERVGLGGRGTLGLKTTPNIYAYPCFQPSIFSWTDAEAEQHVLAKRSQKVTLRTTDVQLHCYYEILPSQLTAYRFGIYMSTASTMRIESSNRHGPLSKIQQQLPLLVICMRKTST